MSPDQSPRIMIANEQTFFSEFAHQIRRTNPGDSILICTMGFYPDYQEIGYLNDIYLDLLSAAYSGVKVSIGVCDYTRVVTEDWPDLYPSTNREIRRRRKQKRHLLSLFKEADQENVLDFRYLRPVKGVEKAVPAMGRNHIKLYGVKQGEQPAVWWFGSSNLHTVPRKTESMVQTSDPDLAIPLEMLYWKTFNGELTHDMELQIKDKYRVFADAGVRHQSLIYEYVQQCIRSAQDHIRIYSLTPLNNDILETLITKAKSNPHIQIEIVLSSITQKLISQFPVSKAYLEMVLRTQGCSNIAISHTEGFLHAKIADIDDTILIMSHNLAQVGVDFGTAEIAIEFLIEPDRKEIRDFCQSEILRKATTLHPRKTSTRWLPIRQAS